MHTYIHTSTYRSYCGCFGQLTPRTQSGGLSCEKNSNRCSTNSRPCIPVAAANQNWRLCPTQSTYWQKLSRIRVLKQKTATLAPRPKHASSSSSQANKRLQPLLHKLSPLCSSGGSQRELATFVPRNSLIGKGSGESFKKKKGSGESGS
jgi:hypothetical protein